MCVWGREKREGTRRREGDRRIRVVPKEWLRI